MARRINKEATEHAYRIMDAKLGLSAMSNVNDMVQALVIHADDIFSNICKTADEIKIENFNRAIELYPDLGMPVGVWLELVNLRRLQVHTELPDSVIEKITQQILGGNNINALRESLLSSLTKSSELIVPTVNDEKKLDYAATESLGTDFNDILNESASLRNALDTELWPGLRTCGDAFSYVTSEPWNAFKFLLDMYHYRNGGWPSDKTPPRFWSIVKRFRDAYVSLDRYGFSMAENWSRRFGLDIKVGHVSPTILTYSDDGAKFGKYMMFKIHDQHVKQYENLGIMPWSHCLISSNRVFIYTWDSREITGIIGTGDIDLSHIHANYIDSCQPLTTKVTQFAELAKGYIPDIFKEA